jgi:hypothetical protein
MTMSGMELGRAAAELETAYKDLDLSRVETALPPLREAFGRFRQAAEAYLQS